MKNRIVFFILILAVLVVFLAGCEAKPIWTKEGWEAYKDGISGTLMGIVKVLLWGTGPSISGFLTAKQLKRSRTKGTKQLIFAFGFILIAVIWIFISFRDDWGWGIYSIICLIFGLLGIVILPKEIRDIKDEDKN